MNAHRLFAACLTLCAPLALAANAPTLECAAPRTASATTPDRGDPKAREAAQRGLEFLVKSATAWQTTNQCYGCHVHSVTMEALSVGLHNQYDIAPKSVDTLLEGMLRLPGGSRGPKGLSYHDDSLLQPSRAFGGAAFARYDAWVGSKVRDDLLKVAAQLLEYQATDGHLEVSYSNGPSARGNFQATYQAIATWKQAYARTADSRWLAPVQRAEGFLQKSSREWMEKKAAVETWDVAYTVMGLSNAGVGPTQSPMPWLSRTLLSKQQADGSFGDALTTGQSVYALRLLGFNDRDKQVSAGTAWLVSHQQKDGGWSNAGFGKAEAMWGVLGLVSVDVMSVAVTGLTDGEHVAETQPLEIEARDNKGNGVQKVELFIDDVKVAEACGGALKHSWATKSISEGRHLVLAVATNVKGEKSQKQLEVFAGNVFLTQVGTGFSGGTTEITARDIALPTQRHQVQLNVKKVEMKDGKPVSGATVFSTTQGGEPGAVKLAWAGKGADGKSQPNGRYFAELVFKDEKGAVLQHDEVLFTHDTAENEAAKYGQVEGKLSLGGGARGAAAAANVEMELVDDKGDVVQRTVSTGEGQYRFKNVDTGKYKVRAKKAGYDFADMPVAAAPAKKSEASGSMAAH